MKNLIAALIAATLLADAISAVAAEVTKPPAAPKSTPVDLTDTDYQVALIAIANAGAACDIGVKVYCQVAAARDATAAKLQGGFDALKKLEAVK